MKAIKIVFLVIVASCFLSTQSSALSPKPKRVEHALQEIFQNFLHRNPSTDPYEHTPNTNEKKHLKGILMSAVGRDENQLVRGVEKKIVEVVSIITERDEYRGKILNRGWQENYWRRFVTKCQKDFEQNYNPNPAKIINELVQKAMKKQWGPDLRNTQTQIMHFFRDAKYFRRYAQQIAHDVVHGKPIIPDLSRTLDVIFLRFLGREPSPKGGANSEINRFGKILKSAKTNPDLLEQKIKEVVNIIVERAEYRDKAGFADWTIKYWTDFIRHCTLTFEKRKVGIDTEWANKIVLEKGRYKTIKNAQNEVLDEFNRSKYYNAWVKDLAHGIFAAK